MRQKQKPNHGIIKLALSLVIATSPIVANVLFNLPTYATAENNKSNFTLPKMIEQGTVINIDGSVNFVILNQSLKEKFEKMFSGTEIKIGINGNEDAVKSVINGTVDLAALGRKLTPEEQAQGLEQLFVRREKIAIIISAKNPFNGKLTTEQFAKIFRGEITDWSELGGEKKPIRFIDRPSNSDTRNAFQEYQIFKKGEFKTGTNTTQITDDSTTEIFKELGDDGISYVLVNQIAKLPDVKTIKIQDFTPEQPDYPFSQSFVYAYKQNPNSKLAGFLGFISAKPGQESIETARQAEGLAIATTALQNISTTTITAPTINITPLTNNTPVANDKVTQQIFVTNSENQQTSTIPENNQGDIFQSFINKENARLVFLLPMVLVPGIGSLIYLWLTRRKKIAIEANNQTSQLEELNVILSNNNHTNLNGANYHQDNNKTIVANSEADITFNQNHSNINLAVIDEPIDITHTESITEERTSELLWDIEAPVIVVNNHYPQIPNIGQNSNNFNISTDELTISELSETSPQPELTISELSETSQQPELTISELSETPPQPELTISELSETPPQPELTISELSEIPQQPENREEQKVNNLSELLSIQTLPINRNRNLSLSELLGIKPTSDFPETLHTALNNIVEQPETTNHQTEQTDVNTILQTEIKPETIIEQPQNLELITTEITDLPTNVNTQIKPEIITEQPQNPELRDFNFSNNTRIIFTPRSPKWAYVSCYIEHDHKQALFNQGIKNLAVRLYDVTHLDLSYETPQLVQQYDCEDGIYDCYVFIPQGEKDYMTEIGYTATNNHWLSLARSGIVHFFSSPHTDVWLVVDTELVIHGATEQGTNITVDGQKVKLNDDGTFKLTVPFVDNLVDYHITATTAAGDESKTIQKKFLQEQKES